MMSQVVGAGAARTPGKRSLAMEGFAAALRAIPATICDNAGAAQHGPAACMRMQPVPAKLGPRPFVAVARLLAAPV